MDAQIISAFLHVALTLAGGVAVGAFTFGALEHQARRGKRRNKA